MAEEANRIFIQSLEMNRKAINESLTLTRKGLDLSNQSLIASQRAWLIPKTMRVTFNDDRTVSVKFRVSNTGRSPATKLSGGMAFVEDGVPSFFRIIGKGTGFPNTLIGPGSENDHELEFRIPFSPTLSQDRIDWMATGKINSRVRGSIFYSDGFADRLLPICGIYKPNQTGYDECPEYGETPFSFK
jgi:hypothetical protein